MTSTEKRLCRLFQQYLRPGYTVTVVRKRDPEPITSGIPHIHKGVGERGKSTPITRKRAPLSVYSLGNPGITDWVKKTLHVPQLDFRFGFNLGDPTDWYMYTSRAGYTFLIAHHVNVDEWHDWTPQIQGVYRPCIRKGILPLAEAKKLVNLVVTKIYGQQEQPLRIVDH